MSFTLHCGFLKLYWVKWKSAEKNIPITNKQWLSTWVDLYEWNWWPWDAWEWAYSNHIFSIFWSRYWILFLKICCRLQDLIFLHAFLIVANTLWRHRQHLSGILLDMCKDVWLTALVNFLRISWSSVGILNNQNSYSITQQNIIWDRCCIPMPNICWWTSSKLAEKMSDKIECPLWYGVIIPP